MDGSHHLTVNDMVFWSTYAPKNWTTMMKKFPMMTKVLNEATAASLAEKPKLQSAGR